MTPCGADTKWFESCNAFVLDIPIACVVNLGAFFHAQYGLIWICLLDLSLAANKSVLKCRPIS